MHKLFRNFLMSVIFLAFWLALYQSILRVEATLDSTGHTLTGDTINIANVASVPITFTFSGTLDSGDVVTVQLINGTWIVGASYTWAGWETSHLFTVDSSSLLDSGISLSGSVIDSWSILVTWSSVTGMITKDTVSPTVVLTGSIPDSTTISWGQTISFTVTLSETSPDLTSGAIVTSGTISNFAGAGTGYTFDVTPVTGGVMTIQIGTGLFWDDVGNPNVVWSDIFSYTVDMTAPDAPVFSTASQTGSMTGIFLAGSAESWTIVNIYSWASILGSWISDTTFSIFVPLVEGANTFIARALDNFGNLSSPSTGVIITSDTIHPTASIEYIPNSWARTTGAVIATLTWASEAITVTNYSWWYTFTWNGSFTFEFIDSVGNTWSSTATVDWIDLWKSIYTNIYDMLTASGINNNFNLVSGGNVTWFTNLYFARLSWSDELGRITFPGALNLTDSAVQTLLQNLWSGDVMNMSQWSISFSPGAAAAMNTWATITMKFASGSTFVSGINSADYFTVLSSTWMTLDPSTIMSSIVGTYGWNSWNITFSAGHFTEFNLKPLLTDVHITSSNINPLYAISGDVITLSITWSEALSWVTMYMGGVSMSVIWWGITRVGTSSITTGSQSIISFTIDFASAANGTTGVTVTGTTDSSSVTFDSVAPTATIIYTPASGTWTSGNVVAVLSWSETLTGENATWYTFTWNDTFTFTFSDFVWNTWSATATVTWIDMVAPWITLSTASWLQFTWSTITITWTGNDTGSALTNVYVNGLLASWTTGWSRTLTWLAAWVTALTITWTDNAGNTVVVTGSIRRIVNIPTGISVAILSWTSVTVGFTTDITATWYLVYGTSSLDTLTGSASATTHTITLDDLSAATTYYYRTYGINWWYTWSMSATWTFITPSATDTIATGAWTYTWDTFLSWSTSDWFTSTVTGTLQINSWSNSISLDLSWLVIDATWGSWDGVILPPDVISFSGNAPSETNYTHVPGLSFIMGSDTVELILWQVATVNLYVGTTYNDKTMHVYRSINNGTTYTHLATCTVSAGVCSFTTDHFSLFSLMQQNTTTSAGWGGSSSISKDNCPDGDTSLSYYDGICELPKTITKKLFGEVLWIWDRTWSLAWSPFTTEINNAYLYAYNLGIVSSPTILWADMEGKLIRSHMAKMIVNYAIKVMWLKPDTTKTCSFGDIGNQASDLQVYIKLSCQLGLMWIGMMSFDPEATITRAQFGTVLSRTLFGDTYNNGKNYYTDHLQALKNAGIMNDISNPALKKEIRWYVLLMMMRADK